MTEKESDKMTTESSSGSFSSNNIADLEIARNRKKDEEGRLKNLAERYVRRETEGGPFQATLWLFRELNTQGVESIKDEVYRLTPYIEEARDNDPNNPLGAA